MRRHLSPTQAAYAAGLIDGEGCIAVMQEHARHIPRVSVIVAMNDYATIRWLRDIFACGSLAEMHHARYKKFACRNSLRWQVRARDSEFVLAEIMPYLIAKRAQAELALEVRRLAGYRGRGGIPAAHLHEAKRLMANIKVLKRAGLREEPTAQRG